MSFIKAFGWITPLFQKQEEKDGQRYGIRKEERRDLQKK